MAKKFSDVIKELDVDVSSIPEEIFTFAEMGFNFRQASKELIHHE